MRTESIVEKENEVPSEVAAAVAVAEELSAEPDSLLQPLKNIVFSVRDGVNSMRAYEQVERA